MLEEVEKEGSEILISKAVRRFPAHFRGSDKANLQKASDWWSKREKIVQKEGSYPSSITSRQMGIRRRVNLTGAPVGGPKRAERGEYLHSELLEEFERLECGGVQFDTRLLLSLATNILEHSGEN